MAKSYSIAGIRTGSVDTVTFSPLHGDTIVRRRVIHVNDAKTIEQVEQRSRMQNALKAFQNIGSSFLNKCFQSKKKKRSYFNEFVSINALKAKNAYPFFEKYSKDPKIIGIGNFIASKGSISSVPVKTFTVGDDTFYGIEVGSTVAVDGNATIGAVSTSLITLYPQIFQEGHVLNCFGVQNIGAKYKNDNDPLTLDDDYHINTVKKNFTLNKTSAAKVFTQGFCVVAGTDTKHYLTLAATATTVNHAVANELDEKEGIGYCGFLAAYKNGMKVNVSSCHVNVNKELGDLLTKIDANPVMLSNGWLSTVMKVLIVLSYGIKKTIEIIRDWPI